MKVPEASMKSNTTFLMAWVLWTIRILISNVSSKNCWLVVACPSLWSFNPFHFPSATTALIQCPNFFSIRINRKGGKGSPFLIPLEGEKVREGEPSIIIEKNDNKVKDIIHWIQGSQNPNFESMHWMYFQLSLSKALDMPSLIIMPTFFVVFKEWIILCTRMILSRICLPST